MYLTREEKDFPNSSYQTDSVVRDKNIITSRGPATAVDFALEIVTILAGEKEAETLKKNILYDKKHTQP